MIIILIIVMSVIIYFIIDYHGPKRISLRPGNAFGLDCLKAKDLIVQEYDASGNLWATRGMILYQMLEGDSIFYKFAHLPSGFSFYWLNNFRIIRKLALNSESVETTITKDGQIIALSAGYMWYSSKERNKFKKTLKLTHYGIGIGRGFLSSGLLKVNDEFVFFGEYFRNNQKARVRILKSHKCGKTWNVAYEFQPGAIRHVHALQSDPYSGKLWICTGDNGNESMIGWSDDNFRTINPIGSGSPIWRSCKLVFTEELIYWGTDTGCEGFQGVYRWEKKTMALTKLQKSNGPILFGTRLIAGTIVFSTSRGLFREENKLTSLIVININGTISNIKCGTWNNNRYRSSFATLRFQRTQGNKSLAISILNQKEFSEGELLIFMEENFPPSFNN
jgi:hypothetical protein